MELEFIEMLKEKRKKENGLMAKDSNGLTELVKINTLYNSFLTPIT